MVIPYKPIEYSKTIRIDWPGITNLKAQQCEEVIVMGLTKVSTEALEFERSSLCTTLQEGKGTYHNL